MYAGVDFPRGTRHPMVECEIVEEEVGGGGKKEGRRMPVRDSIVVVAVYLHKACTLCIFWHMNDISRIMVSMVY